MSYVDAIEQGDVKTATGFHERHQELAQAVDIPEEQKKANAALINVRETGGWGGGGVLTSYMAVVVRP